MRKFRKHLLPAFCLIVFVGFLAFRLQTIDVFQTSREQTIVVIDAGHGGFDPGKVSPDNTLEKDINLAIALRLKSYLEAQDCQVYLTRDSDCSLADESSNSKKQSDMRNRVAFVEQLQPDLMISIHQNSFSSSKEHGAQTFYYYNSESSQFLAECVQSSLIKIADPENTRTFKSNDSYYILKNVSCPAVLIECGFLSNPTETALLNTEIYQDKIAYAISVGVRKYLNQ